MQRIASVKAREILDSRGYPTVEVEMTTDQGWSARAAVPSGASTGTFEALELRDAEPHRYLGKGVMKAVRNVNEVIAPKLKGGELNYQNKLDEALCGWDGTENKSKLGANAILGVSLAYAHLSARVRKIPLYKLIAELSGQKGQTIPVPLMNIINGGRHASNPLDIQEFMIVPIGESYRESLRMGVEVFHHLARLLKKQNLSIAVGDEGGFAPPIENAHAALFQINHAIREAGYLPGKDIFVALDVAASEFYENGFYKLRTEDGPKRSVEQLIGYYEKLKKEFPIVSIEDGLAEEDWNGWQRLTTQMGEKVCLVGDDLFVTNEERLKGGIEKKVANAILIKLNQIGTLSETIKTINTAKQAGYRTIISHRSGETEDTTIADLAVGTDAGLIKTGSLSRSERLAKYNQLLRIEEELAGDAVFLGQDAFR